VGKGSKTGLVDRRPFAFCCAVAARGDCFLQPALVEFLRTVVRLSYDQGMKTNWCNSGSKLF
jgi:hypothetical protein